MHAWVTNIHSSHNTAAVLSFETQSVATSLALSAVALSCPLVRTSLFRRSRRSIRDNLTRRDHHSIVPLQRMGLEDFSQSVFRVPFSYLPVGGLRCWWMLYHKIRKDHKGRAFNSTGTDGYADERRVLQTINQAPAPLTDSLDSWEQQMLVYIDQVTEAEVEEVDRMETHCAQTNVKMRKLSEESALDSMIGECWDEVRRFQVEFDHLTAHTACPATGQYPERRG